MTASPQRDARGDLQIIEEWTMVEVPRGREGRECLRLQFVRAKTGDGKDVAWHSIREFYLDQEDNWRPGRKGITIRGAELKAITEGLLKAASSGGRS